MTRSHRAQRGFTIVELLVAMTLLTVLLLASLGAMHFFIGALDGRTYDDGGAASVERTLATMRTDADTAFAVFVPTSDVFGAANAGTSSPHEVDYYAKTDTGADTWWAYYFDAAAQTLQRFDYDPVTKARGVFDRTTGAIDPAGRYPKVADVRAFAVRSLQANALTDARVDPYAPLLRSLIGSLGTARAEPVGFVPADGRARSDLYGGNTTIVVTLAARNGTHEVHLTTGTMPSGFTVHERLAIKAIVYRLDTVHRSWFGFVQKTKAQIFEQLQYSYHPLTDPPASWKVWCDFQLYGYGAGGLTLGDPNTKYRPYDNFYESAGYVFYNVTHGGYAKLNPSPACSERVPSIDESPAPSPTGTSPDVIDTPPPCFLAGTCWPDNAPQNWAPASPWPLATPPPAWCATHQQSTLCGGSGGTPAPTTSLPPPVYFTNPPTAASPVAFAPSARTKTPHHPMRSA